MKQFKARIEWDNGINFHAMEVWLQADSIIDAGNVLMRFFDVIGITPDHVKKLIEIDN